MTEHSYNCDAPHGDCMLRAEIERLTKERNDLFLELGKFHDSPSFEYWKDRAEKAEKELAESQAWNAKLTAVLEWIAEGCLVPPDGGSPRFEDALKEAQSFLDSSPSSALEAVRKTQLALRVYSMTDCDCRSSIPFMKDALTTLNEQFGEAE